MIKVAYRQGGGWGSECVCVWFKLQLKSKMCEEMSIQSVGLGYSTPFGYSTPGGGRSINGGLDTLMMCVWGNCVARRRGKSEGRERRGKMCVQRISISSSTVIRRGRGYRTLRTACCSGRDPSSSPSAGSTAGRWKGRARCRALCNFVNIYCY